MLLVYDVAWHQAHDAPGAQPGDGRRAGLAAVFRVLEQEPKQLMELLHDSGVPATEYAAYLAARRGADQ